LTSYLYVLSIGPVQDFISAARRTRDLWFGSHLLSEISKTAARTIAESGGELIFPALKTGAPNLKPSRDLEAFNVANIILAMLPEENGIDPAALNEKAKLEARNEWKRYANEALAKAGRAVPTERKRIWEEQVEDVIEFYAAWVPCDDNYEQARSRAMRLLAGRKSIRDFKQAVGRHGIPKSSLDGARESVIQVDEKIPKWLALQMRLSDGEQLCAVGLTKRLGGESDSGRMAAFPSVVRVALDPWLRGIRKSGDEANRLLDEICIQCTGDNSFSSGTGKRLYQDFPFDGQIFFPSRMLALKEKLEGIAEDSDKDNRYKKDPEKLDLIEKSILRLQSKDDGCLGFGEPDPYLAILVADGDRMGKAISMISDSKKYPKELHQKFSRALAKFAGDARRIVEGEKHRGCMVYSGGDDVLAFLPVDKCLGAARDLHDAFEKLLEGYPDLKEIVKTLTLSVGIAIVHSLEPLEDILEYGRAMETLAKKPDRNGLAISLHTRSGGSPITIREQWKLAGESGLDERLADWADMYFNDKIPDKAAYDMRALSEDYKNWAGVSQELIEKDLTRLLKRKKAGSGTSDISKGDIEKLMKGVTSNEDLARRSMELILARKIAEVKLLDREPVKKEVVQ
jgi:CRISPR-associated protein Cmr2